MVLVDLDREIPMFPDYPDALSLKEMCALLKICTKTGRQLLNSGKIRSLRVGRSFVVPKLCLISFVTGIPLD